MKGYFAALATPIAAATSLLAQDAPTDAAVITEGITYNGGVFFPSYAIEGPVRVGTILPDSGVTYYDVPQQYGATSYRYTVVNERPSLVDPRSRRIMQVID